MSARDKICQDLHPLARRRPGSPSLDDDGDGVRFSRQVGTGPVTRSVTDPTAGLPVTIDDGTHKYVWGLGLAYAVSGTAIERPRDIADLIPAETVRRLMALMHRQPNTALERLRLMAVVAIGVSLAGFLGIGLTMVGFSVP